MIQLRAHNAAWPFTVQFLSNLGHAAAIRYLASGATKLVLLLSAIENSPYAVLECLALGIPFLAMDVGGIAELIPVEQRHRVLVSPATRLGGGSNAERVAQRMLAAVVDGVRADTTAILAATPVGARDAWIGFHDALGRVQGMLSDGRQAAQKRQPESAPPLVSVVICHHDRGMHLIESIRSVLHQTHTRIELVIVDDGSVETESLAVLELVPSALDALHLPLHQRARVLDRGGRQARGQLNMDARANQNDALLAYMMDRWRGGSVLANAVVVLNANQMPGASRNLGVQLARGDFVAFLDDDDLARPHWLATLLQVAHATRASVVTSTLDFFADAQWRPWEADRSDASDRFRDTAAIAVQARWLPVGAAVSAGLFENVFGAYAALWHRQALLQLGGFTEEADSTFEDWELFATAVLADRSLELVAEPLLLYRQYHDASRAAENHSASEHSTAPQSQTHLMGRGGSATKYLNEQRAMRPYLRAAPASMRNALELAVGLYRGGGGSQ